MVSVQAICEWFPPETDGDVPEGHECGYCKDNEGNKTKGSKSNGLWVHEMSTLVYQKMIDRGWRRSGSYCYKPCMAETCCPQYTIRQPTNKFKITKSQRKALRKFSQKLNVDTAGLDWTDMIKAHEKSGKMEVKLVKVGSKEYEDSKEASLEIYKKYQVEVHKDEPDEITMKQWSRFLCSPPRKFEDEEDKNQGAYHQQYWLEGKLICVGVVDWLSHSLSSVYLYYDPDFSDYNLGVYSALQEIKFCLDNEIPYYYLGFYVPGCSKMEYKAAYKPSELLCPETLTWVDLDERVLSLFKTGKYHRLQEDSKIIDYRLEKLDARYGLLLFKRTIYKMAYLDEEEDGKGPVKFELYYRLVGKELSENFMLCYYSK